MPLKLHCHSLTHVYEAYAFVEALVVVRHFCRYHNFWFNDSTRPLSVHCRL